MDFEDSPPEAEFRRSVREFLDANVELKQSDKLREQAAVNLPLARKWQSKKADARFAGICLPARYGGRDGTMIQQLIYEQEEARYAVPNQGMLFTIGLGMCIPTLLAYAEESVLERHVLPALRGDEIWCQLFSEPSGGSDLASLRTQAVRTGDGWLVNGQKIWTSGAQHSDFGLLLARTDSSVPKHKGLTAFFVNMKTPGVEIRPIRQMNGRSGFNEVFFGDVLVPDANRLGEPGEGWKVATKTLMNERLAVGRTGMGPGAQTLVELACQLGVVSRGSHLAHRIVDLHVRESGVRYTTARVMTSISKGRPVGPEASVIKYVKAWLLSDVTNLILDMQGFAGVVTDPSHALLQGWGQSEWLRAPGEHIAGGTDEILLNVIAERVLGLPAEIRVDRDIPFNKLPSQ